MSTHSLKRTFVSTWSSLCATAALSFNIVSSSALAAKGDVSILGAKAYLGQGKYLENATVILRDGKIYKINSNKPASKDSQVIHAEGKILTPGLIAAQTPLGLVEIEAEDSTNDSRSDQEHAVRASYEPARAIFADSSALSMAMRWGVTNAAVAPTGGVVSGQVAWIDLRPSEHERIVVEPSVAMCGTLGQTHTGSRAATLQLFEALFDDALLYRVQKRAHQRGDLRHLSAPARELAALDPVLRGKQRLLLRVQRASDILGALDLASRYKIKVALVGAQEGWKVAEQIAKADAWVVLRPTDNLPESFARLGSRLDNAARLHRAGVKLVIANYGSAHNAAQLRQEAGNAVAHGLPYAQALDAITSAPAALYGMQDEYGSLTPGKVANLVVWSGDPLEFSSAAQIVIVRGEIQDRPNRQTRLRNRYLQLDRFSPAKLPRFPSTNPVQNPNKSR